MQFSIIYFFSPNFGISAKFWHYTSSKWALKATNFNTNSYFHFVVVLMAILDPGQQSLTTPVVKAAISFADIEENLGLSVNPGP